MNGPTNDRTGNDNDGVQAEVGNVGRRSRTFSFLTDILLY